MQSQRFRRQNRIKTDEVSLKQMPVNWYKSQAHVQKDLNMALNFIPINSKLCLCFVWVSEMTAGLSRKVHVVLKHA